ncbi:bifunctional riboflavin kinase/FAD synthetase [Metabacillus arenae]|uniref:bifunctional riboflavin kinase/FAD synthetase n=1 Tax=Metabacillus arenae TaxID=2771434 RepID=UPI001CD09007|nr:bifunctional riboflavin kinase/FAD synthetase [Metabacillus arenae]
MKTIELSHPHQFSNTTCPESVMALGYFDGVHRGHQKVIKTAVKLANEKNMLSAVMTFHPHPSIVLRKQGKQVDLITPIEEKIQLIEDMGVDLLYLVHFTEEFASLLPQEFVDSYLINLNVKHVVAGFDFSYGKMGKGTMESLPFHSREKFTQTIVTKLTEHDRKISSTLIRKVISSGDVTYAWELLGRPHFLYGEVIHGDKRGRTIGFPTANIETNDQYLLPPTGVYAVRVMIDGEKYDGVCNVGYKPTFHKSKQEKPSVEVHIFDFNDQIYEKNIKLSWYKRIRSEQKFNTVDELIQQIKRDKESAQDYFKKNMNDPCFLR